MAIKPVELSKSFRLLNHGPTTMISAKHNGVENVMSASWVGLVDIVPARVSLVLGKEAFTRELVEKSGYFAIQVPFATQAEQVLDMGESRKTTPNKLESVELFYQESFDVPLVAGSAAWLICKVLPETEMQQKYDLFLADVVGAWADDRVFRNGHWHFDDVSEELKTLHYIAGGQFYATGKGINLKDHPNAIG